MYRIVGFEVEPQSIHSSAMSRVEGDKCQVQREDMKVMELKNSSESVAMVTHHLPESVVYAPLIILILIRIS